MINGLNGHFYAPTLGDHGISVGPSVPLISRVSGASVPSELQTELDAINRGDFGGDLSKVVAGLSDTISRTISTATTAFPVRENLEAEAKVLIPLETPVRNLLPRVPGAGTAAAWRQATALGGGWPTGTDQPGSAAAAQAFYAENGAPASLDVSYAAKSAGYKLLGTMGSVTGLAAAAGRNFQDQLAYAKVAALKNVMLLEEYALINGSSTSAAAPFGNGSTAYGFDGLINLIATANGTPSGQVQTAVGALTFAHIDAQLKRLKDQGGNGLYMLMNGQECASLAHLAEANGTMHRIMIGDPSNASINLRVTKYVHPITGDEVDVIYSRFVPAGTILFGSRYLPDGSSAAKVSVLPQIDAPIAPGDNIQGYVARDIAATATAPDVFNFLVSIYEVPMLMSSVHFAKSTGVTAV